MSNIEKSISDFVFVCFDDESAQRKTSFNSTRKKGKIFSASHANSLSFFCPEKFATWLIIVRQTTISYSEHLNSKISRNWSFISWKKTTRSLKDHFLIKSLTTMNTKLQLSLIHRCTRFENPGEGSIRVWPNFFFVGGGYIGVVKIFWGREHLFRGL